jgi:hypothetical protein
MCLHVIDSISQVEYPYTTSTCDVMYRRQRRHLYYGGENLNYYLTSSPAVLPSYEGISDNQFKWDTAQNGRGVV